MQKPTLDDLDLLRVLKVFTWAVDLQGFSAAARQLGMTPGAVSKHIGALEAALGRRLFQRTTRQLAPTEEGRRLYELVRGPAQELAEALAAFADVETQWSGPVRVSLPMAFIRNALLPSMGEFRARYPAISLDLRFENRAVDLIGEGFDCAIGNVPEGERGSLVARPLLPITQVLCASPEYLANREPIRQIADLDKHELILFRSPDTNRIQSWNLENAANKITFNPHGNLIVSDMEALLHLTLAGCGVALLGVHHGIEHFIAKRLTQVLPDYISPRSDIAIYYPARKHLAPRVAVFIDFVVATIRDSEFTRQVRSFFE